MPCRHRRKRDTEIGTNQIRPYPQMREDASEWPLMPLRCLLGIAL